MRLKTQFLLQGETDSGLFRVWCLIWFSISLVSDPPSRFPLDMIDQRSWGGGLK